MKTSWQNLMKTSVLAAAMGATALAVPMAAQAGESGDWGGARDGGLARVVSVAPIVREVRVPGPPVMRCEPGTVMRPMRSDPVGATLVGGLIGGAIGQRLAEDRNPAAMVAGAIIGGAIGHTLAEQQGVVARPASVCRPVPMARIAERVVAYRVTYRYHGRLYVTRMHERPGRFLRVQAIASPLD